jgi:parvulin-like peptidyl-prolyl isomerase
MPLVWAFVAIFVLGAVFSFNSASSRGRGGSDDYLFARVGDQDVTKAQFAQNLEMMREQYKSFASYGQGATLQQYSELPRYAWEQLLDEYAQAAAAEKMGVSVSGSEAQAELEKQVDEQLNRIAAGEKPELRAQYREALLARADVESQRRHMLAQRLREKLSKEAQPVEVKVAHVLIKTDSRSDAAALKLAQEVARQAKAGSDFAKLANQYSEDQGSKVKGGEVGWASAMPPSPPTGKNAKPDPEAATSFVPEFTAASLMLKKGQVSEPVKSTFGYHVIKALDVRSYQPKVEGKPDEKKRQEGVEQYKSQMANQISQGLVSAEKARLEATVKPSDPWLKAYLKEQEANKAPLTLDKSGKPATNETQKLAPVIAAYEEAMKGKGPEVGPPLAYKLAQLYQRAERYADANTLLEKWAKRSGDTEMYFLQGEIQEKLKKKTDALASFQSSLESAYNNPDVLNRLADKFKELGRADLAQQAREKQTKQVARQAEERARQQKMFEEQNRQVSTKPAAGKKDDAVQEITVKTGAIDPKTGKPKILSVTPTGKNAKPDAKTDAKESAPAKP